MRDHWYYTADERYLTYLQSKEWRAIRQKVIQRCNNICERCGKLPVAEVHHLTYARVFQEKLEDLQGLCEYCHEFVHGESTEDGAAAYERIVKQQEELQKCVEFAQFELQRFEEKPEVYRTFVDSDFTSHRELMAMLRQNPRFISGGKEGEIFDVRHAKRKYESGIAFKVKSEIQIGYLVSTIKSAEALLYCGKLLFDTERGLWIEIESIRRFFHHNEAVLLVNNINNSGINSDQ